MTIYDSGSMARVDLVSAEGGSEQFINSLRLVSAVIEGVVVIKRAQNSGPAKLGLRHVFQQFASSSPNSQKNTEDIPTRKCLEMAMDTQALRGRLLHSSTRFQHTRILFQSHRTHQ